MGHTSNKSKQRYNDSHYSQVKISVKPEVASAFKEACAVSNVSIAGVLSQFMETFSGRC
jgi:hypothetical protein